MRQCTFLDALVRPQQYHRRVNIAVHWYESQCDVPSAVEYDELAFADTQATLLQVDCWSCVLWRYMFHRGQLQRFLCACKFTHNSQIFLVRDAGEA